MSINLYHLFKSARRVILTTKEISQKCGISPKCVGEHLKKEIQSGYLMKNNTSSSYYLTLEGVRALYRFIKNSSYARTMEDK